MQTTDVTFTNVITTQMGGNNILFTATYNGASLNFRIHYYANKARKNSTYTDYKVGDIYFEGIDPGSDPEYKKSYYVHHVTDLCIFMERYKQWVLEKIVNRY